MTSASSVASSPLHTDQFRKSIAQNGTDDRSAAAGVTASMSRESPVEERYLMYLAKAEEAREIARTLTDKQARESWEQLAKSWEQLALQVKQTLSP